VLRLDYEVRKSLVVIAGEQAIAFFLDYTTSRLFFIRRRLCGLPVLANIATFSNTRNPSLTASAVPKCRHNSGAMTTAWAPFGKRWAFRPRTGPNRIIPGCLQVELVYDASSPSSGTD